MKLSTQGISTGHVPDADKPWGKERPGHKRHLPKIVEKAKELDVDCMFISRPVPPPALDEGLKEVNYLLTILQGDLTWQITTRFMEKLKCAS